jgi:hypothetical protein
MVKNITVSLDEAFVDKLKATATTTGRTVSGLIRLSVQRFWESGEI